MGEKVNERKRKSLREAIQFLNRAIFIVDGVCDQEQDAIDNLPEGLQASERCEAMELAVDSLNDATEKIEEAKEYIESAIG